MLKVGLLILPSLADLKFLHHLSKTFSKISQATLDLLKHKKERCDPFRMK